MIKKMSGITLLETILVLAVITMVILLGTSQYTVFKKDSDAFALKYSVDTLFQAMRDYYYANCAKNTLAPANNPSDPFAVNITSDLGPYMSGSWQNINPIIDTTFGSSGYSVQFNRNSLSGRKENFCYFFPNTSQTTPSCNALSNNTAVIYLWVAQVVVKVKNPKLTLAYQGLTGADCAVSSFTVGDKVDCSSGATSGNPAYLVWQRLPSFASPKMSSGLWGALPYAKDFNLQYTNDRLSELVGATYAGTQYYLCGG